MRESLQSLQREDPSWDGYPAGSIVVCGDCFRPIYVLERTLDHTTRGGRSASAFRPLTPEDLAGILQRRDLNAQWQQLLREYVERHPGFYHDTRPKTGDKGLCPLCGQLFARFTAETKSEALDLAYVVQMHTIAPVQRIEPYLVGAHQPTRWVQPGTEEEM